MKANESFEEKASLSSYMPYEDYSSLENIPKEINNFNTPINNEIQNFKHSIFDSKFININNSNCQISKSISDNINNSYEEKESPKFINYFSHSNYSNYLLNILKKSFFENGQKLWSQIGEENKSMNQYSKLSNNDIIWNTNKIRNINNINKFQDFNMKENMIKENNGILNNLTQNLNDINNNQMLDYNNNNKMNGYINYASNNISLNCYPKQFIFNSNNLKYAYNPNENKEEEKNNENLNFGNNKKFFDINEEENFDNFKKFCENLKIPLSNYICSLKGSKRISKYLNRYCDKKINYLIEKLYMNFERIICNKYGNYFFQKLYIKSQKQYRIKILNLIKDYFITVSKNEIGAIVIQRIIEVIESNEERNKIINYINGYELEMSLDKEGTHLIQSIIETFPENERQNLTNVICISKNIKKLLKDKNGVNIIKRLIEHNKNSSNRNKLKQALLHSSIFKILNSYNGSYIIYYLIKNWGIDSGIIFIKILISNFEFFANNKQSAILIYKIISFCRDNLLIYLHNNAIVNNFYNYKEFIILKILTLLIYRLNNSNGEGKILYEKVKLFLNSIKD